MTRVCRVCSRPAAARTRAAGRAPMYCGQACRDSYNNKVRSATYRERHPDKIRSRIRPVHPPRIAVCHCGTTFKPVGAQRYCSPKCNPLVFKCRQCGEVKFGKNGKPARVEGERAYCSPACRAIAREPSLLAQAERDRMRAAARIEQKAEREAQRLVAEAARSRNCPRCGVAFYAHNGHMRFCTDRCRHLFHAPPHGPIAHECVECHEGFESLSPHARYCSNACRRRAGKRAPGEHARRRAREKIKRMRPRLIERWGMVCYLCKGSIDFGPEVVHPGAFTLDHVVPITAGGRDTEDNLRPAHRACNEDKGERLPAWWELRQAHIA